MRAIEPRNQERPQAKTTLAVRVVVTDAVL
jgi:hypothetical protein